jgi:hypothetical protein
VALAAAAVLAVVLLSGTGGATQASARACPAGTRPLTERLAEELVEGRAKPAGEREGGKGEASDERKVELLREKVRCVNNKTPEPAKELTAISTAQAARFGQDSPGAYAAAIARGAKLGATPGGGGRWKPVGTTPLISDDPTYEDTFGNGFSRLAGRISDFAYGGGQLYAAVASGGVYASGDLGRNWRSVGDTLPIQQVGSVAYTSSHGGTVLALSGDNAFGGYTYAGEGVYRTTNGGRSWKRSTGVPRGSMGFKLAVDPTNPDIVYAATGLGLYRSTNGGVSFRNVNLPTGRCAGKITADHCFLGNVVTDVVVQGKDTFGHRGGAVLAVVGWRSGAFKNGDGTTQSPENGLYTSDTGAPGTFQNVDEDRAGFAPQAAVGRTELGAATGPDQNHGYVYAVVQDAQLFNSGKVEGLDIGADGDPLGLGVDPTATPTYLNGVYVSKDFGHTWSKLADREQFQLPTTGSTLAQLQPLGFGPGIQSWYDLFVKPDPTRQVNGVPTRLSLGLEEVYENRITRLPVDGRTDFKTVGAYNANSGGCLLVLATSACSAKQRLTPGNTTTHPDQHANIWIPDGKGGVTLVVGNDGGAYVQKLASGQEVTQSGFGQGADSGFHTLLPYGVDIARDGIVYAGLQDNGEVRIDKAGRQNAVYGGDGVFTVVDPKNSDTVWEETPEAGISFSTDGGKSWTSAYPNVTNASFYSPLLMDPADSKHLVTGGRQVAETTHGTDTGSSSDTDWVNVFDLGTQKHPGDANAQGDLATDPENQLSAAQVQGAAVYAGFCGGCDPVRDHNRFANGIATNVGGGKPPKPGSADGWHVAKAKGLPSRLITSITIDPKNARTIYVTLGSSSLRPYVPAGGLGPDGISRSGGFVYKSTNAGASFRNITGNLPKIGAGWSVLRGEQLVVGTTTGVYGTQRSIEDQGTPTWGTVGKGLPKAPVFSMRLRPGNPNALYIASLGRGVYKLGFTKPPSAIKRTCTDRARPSATYSKKSRITRRGIALRGSAKDRGCRATKTRLGRKGKVKYVRVAVARRSGSKCRWLKKNGTFGARRSCKYAGTIFRAKGAEHWRFGRKLKLKKGRYVAVIRPVDRFGNRERHYVKKGFRVR